MMLRDRNPSSVRQGQAFSLAETLISMVLVGGLLVASLNTVGSAKLGKKQVDTRTRGMLLGQDFLSEIVALPYEDPDGSPVFGPEAGENGANRAGFDDVDDYVNWTMRQPKKKDGTAILDFPGWTRAANVTWADAADLTGVGVTDSGIKKITVSTAYNGVTIVNLLAIKSPGPPPPMPALNLLFVVADKIPTAGEQNRISMFQSWGFIVSTINDSAIVADYVTAAVNADVAYVSEAVVATELASKLQLTIIGVVNENIGLVAVFGFDSGATSVNDSSIWIFDNSHYITSTNATGVVSFVTSVQPQFVTSDTAASRAEELCLLRKSGVVYDPAILALDAGVARHDVGTSPGRRVQLPFGSGFDINALTVVGKTLVQRSIQWAGNREDLGSGLPVANCGDATCDAGEDSCNCAADCGVPPANETPGSNCSDGIDNDCDGFTDCFDANCGADASCAMVAVACGNNICEPTENCMTCSIDCPGPGGTGWCCGNGTLEAAEGDGSICDFNP